MSTDHQTLLENLECIRAYVEHICVLHCTKHSPETLRLLRRARRAINDHLRRTKREQRKAGR